MFEVLETAQKVAEKSVRVRINRDALVHFSQKWLDDGIDVPAWDIYHHYTGTPEDTVAYLLVLDSLNFCFWPLPGRTKWEIEYRGEKISGYYALSSALKKAIEDGIPVTQAAYLVSLDLKTLGHILKGCGELQLMEKRLDILHELGRVLLSDYHGQPYEWVASVDHSATLLARTLASKLSSFRDVAMYHGEAVHFLKRAQIFTADLYGAFQGKGMGQFNDMHMLTAFADYKLPQVLRHAGIIEYDENLGKKVDQKMLIEPGSPEEVEIRANTIRAVELIRRELEKIGTRLKAFEIDWALWNLGQQESFRKKPYHRTVTIFY